MTDLIQHSHPANTSHRGNQGEAPCEFALTFGAKSIQFRGPERWVNERLEEFSEQIRIIRSEQLLGSEDASVANITEDRRNSSSVVGESRSLKGFDIPQDVIDEVFDLDGERSEIILPDLPGASKKEKTHAAYLLVGLGTMLKTGEVNFADDAARSVCQTYSVLDIGNHAATLKDLKDCMLGSKAEGWRLSKPGIRRALDVAAAGAAMKIQ